MKAIVYDKVGGPDVLKYKIAPEPLCGPGQAIVKVMACGINLLDYYLRIEEDPEMLLPHIMGSDIAGVITKIDTSCADGWKVGDEVIVSAAIENFKPGRAGIVGYQINGGYAEYASVPARNLLRKPKNITFVEAATLPLVGQTAYHQMVTRARLTKGETVLILGANSGIGCMAKTLADAIGSRSICTVSSDVKVQKAGALGWTDVINHALSDWEKRVLDITNGQGVDVVIDHMGGAYTEAGIRLSKTYGRIACIGSTQGDEVRIKLSELYRKQLSIMGSYMGTVEELQEVIKLAANGKIKPIIDKVFELKDAGAAHMYLESRQHFGKIVLKVA